MRLCPQKFKRFLKFVSPGQLQLGLYYKGQTTFGSAYGGIFAICAALFLMVYGLYVIVPVFTGSQRSVETSINQLNTAIDLNQLTANDIFSQIDVIRIDAKIDTNITQTQCDEESQVYLDIKHIEDDYEYCEDYSIKIKLNCTNAVYDPSENTTYVKFKAYLQTPEVLEQFKLLNQSLIVMADKKSERFYSQYHMVIKDLSKTFNFFRVGFKYEQAFVSNGLVEYHTGMSQDLETDLIDIIKVSSKFIIENKTSSIIGYDTKYVPSIYMQAMSIDEISTAEYEYFRSIDFEDFWNYRTYNKLSRIQIEFTMASQVLFIEVNSLTLVAALSKIGGMLAFVKMFSSLIQYVNLQLFQKRLKKMTSEIEPIHENQDDNEKKYSKTAADDDQQLTASQQKLLEKTDPDHGYKEIFSFDQYALMVKEIQKMKNENSNLKYAYEDLREQFQELKSFKKEQ